jgi:hypothetical protein
MIIWPGPFINAMDFLMIQFQQVLLCLVTGGLLLSAGCSAKSDQPDLGVVRGTVTIDGKPLEGAVISFSPTEGGRVSQDKTDAKGSFNLIYIGNTRGAKTGKHSVRITTAYEAVDPTTGQMVEQEERVPKRYNSTNTVLAADIKPGKNTVDFDLQSTP